MQNQIYKQTTNTQRERERLNNENSQPFVIMLFDVHATVGRSDADKNLGTWGLTCTLQGGTAKIK